MFSGFRAGQLIISVQKVLYMTTKQMFRNIYLLISCNYNKEMESQTHTDTIYNNH